MNVSVSEKRTYALAPRLNVLPFTVLGWAGRQLEKKLHVNMNIILLLQSAFGLSCPCRLTAFLVRVLSVFFLSC